VKTNHISWRSFRDTPGKGPSISEQWKNIALPTVYVVDEKGLIRNRWIGAPPSEEVVNSAIDHLLAALR
jgi:hypothetical protein